jgi:3-hydroxyisobutyrate dehydrogenase-like beta-hydroxyacid dehydrogenase
MYAPSPRCRGHCSGAQDPTPLRRTNRFFAQHSNHVTSGSCERRNSDAATVRAISGILGLGAIGRPIAERLASGASPVCVHDVRTEAAEGLSGATVAQSIPDLAAQCDLVCVAVLDDGQVADVVDQIATTAEPETIVAVDSTVGDELIPRLASRYHHLRIVDASVTGGPAAVYRGEHVVMLGGSEAVFEICRQRFASFGGLVVHAWPIGSATRMKLARNVIQYVSFAAAAEARALAAAGGVDLLTLEEVVRRSDVQTGGPGAILAFGSMAVNDPRGYEAIERVVRLGEKHLGCAKVLAQPVGVAVPMIDSTAGHLRALLAPWRET